jgi:hydrogenase 3 maturation protease
MKKVVISVGNPLRSDDDIGNLVLDEIKKSNKNKDLYFLKGSANPENFIEPLKKINPDTIFFVDVAKFEGEAGDVKLFKLEDILNYNISTHNFSVTMFKKYFPNSNIFLIGVKPKKLDVDENISPELKQKFPTILKKIKKIIGII